MQELNKFLVVYADVPPVFLSMSSKGEKHLKIQDNRFLFTYSAENTV